MSLDQARQPLAYRLSLHRSLEAYRPEIEFACAFVDRCHPVARAREAPAVVHYGAEPPVGAVTVPAVLFPHAVRTDEFGIHPDWDGLAGAEEGRNGALLPAAGRVGDVAAQLALAYDALGLIFLLLSRLEERGSRRHDRYGRYPLDASLLFRHARPDTPLADIAARDLASALLGTAKPSSRTAYRVWLTHDIDRLRGYHHPLDPLRNAVGDVVKRRSVARAGQRLWRAYASGEPWRSCRHIMDLSERRGFTSRFYFMGPTDDRMDSPYVLREPRVVRRLADEIAARGHAVGFHPGFQTRRNPSEWRRQKEGLEEVLGRPLSEGRHHVLLFDAETTWDMWDEGGMTIDTTLGYSEHSGFRSGTCRGHSTYSLRRRRILELLEIPSSVMDFSFFDGRYRDMTVDEALAECQPIIDACRRHGGDLVVLFHPGNMSTRARTWYERLVESLSPQ